MSDYLFPRLFVKGVRSDEYALIDGDVVIFTREQKEENAYGKIPYETPLSEIIDLLGEVTKKDFIVHLPKEKKAIVVPKNTPVKIIRSAHAKVGLSVSEGDQIEAGEEVAKGLTTKGEIRSIKSKENGIVVMIHWEPQGGRDIYHIIVAPRENVRILSSKF